MLDAESFLKQKYGFIWCYVRYINWITFESGNVTRIIYKCYLCSSSFALKKLFVFSLDVS